MHAALAAHSSWPFGDWRAAKATYDCFISPLVWWGVIHVQIFPSTTYSSAVRDVYLQIIAGETFWIDLDSRSGTFSEGRLQDSGWRRRESDPRAAHWPRAYQDPGRGKEGEQEPGSPRLLHDHWVFARYPTFRWSFSTDLCAWRAGR